MSSSSPQKSWQEGVLCNECQHLVAHISLCLAATPEFRSGGDITHHQTATSLLASASTGCHLCSLIVGTTFLSNGSSPREAENQLAASASYSPLIKISKPYSNSHAHYRMGGPPKAIIELIIDAGPPNMIFVMPQDKSPVGHLGMSSGETTQLDKPPRSPLCDSTAGSESLQLAGWWLRRCRQEHTECQDPTTYAMAVRPRRLLDLSKPHGDVRVVTLSDDRDIPEFFALSYVWGTQECTRLTITTFEAMHKRFEVLSLPRTIRDAVTVTRALGYGYLWVDSLCIIQDSEEDWAAESVKMGGIYRRAVLTIAALHASGNHEGLIARRNPLCARSLPIPGTNLEISNTANYVFWEHQTGNAPLHSRAWVVQERFSAIRTLFFGASGLFWECGRCQASESDVTGTLEPPDTNFKKNISDVLKVETSDETGQYRRFTRLWAETLSVYTSTNLTKETDRPVAISGLTNFLSSATGYTISNGIWLNTAPLDLCWESQQIEEEIEDPADRAPSWSWLKFSVRHPVHILLKSNKYFVVWEDSAQLVGLPSLETSGQDTEVARSWPALAAALRSRPQGCLSFLTDFLEVYLLPNNLLTLKKPTESMRKNFASNGKRSQSDDDLDPSDSPETYRWTPDLPVDSMLTEAWFVHLAHFESWDGKRTGEAGLIALNKYDRAFERIGVIKKWIFKDASVSNYASGAGGKDTRYLPPNPFAKLKNVVRLAHLV